MKTCVFLIVLAFGLALGEEYNFDSSLEGFQPHRDDWRWGSRDTEDALFPGSNDGFALMSGSGVSDELYLRGIELPLGGRVTFTYFGEAPSPGTNALYLQKSYESAGQAIRLLDVSDDLKPYADEWNTASVNLEPDEQEFFLGFFCFNSATPAPGSYFQGCAIDNVIIEDFSVTEPPTPTTTTTTTTAAPTTTEELVETTETKVETTVANIETTEANVVTTEANVETTEVDVETTEVDVETTEANVETTEVDVDTTEVDVETTEVDIETTESNVETTEANVETTESNVETTVVYETTIVYETTEVDVDTTESNVETTEANVETTEGQFETSIIYVDTTVDVVDTTTDAEVETTEQEVDTTTEILSTTPLPYLKYDFQDGSQGWTFSHMNGASWRRVRAENESDITVGAPSSGPWVVRVEPEEMYSGVTLAQSPIFVATAEQIMVRLKFWMSGSQNYPADLKIRKRTSFLNVDQDPIMNLDNFGDQVNQRYLEFTVYATLDIGEEFALNIEGSVGGNVGDNVVVVSEVVVVGVEEAFVPESEIFDFETGLVGWTPGNMDGGEWVVKEWEGDAELLGVPKPVSGNKFLFVNRFDIYSGVISIETPPFRMSPGTNKELSIKFWTRGSVIYPAAIRFRMKTEGGLYQDLPFLNLEQYGDAEHQAWVYLEQVYTINYAEGLFQIVIEADLGSDEDNLVALDDLQILSVSSS